MPEQAFTDLRARFRHLSRAFGLPLSSNILPDGASFRPPRREQLCSDHPATEVACGETLGAEDAHPGADDADDLVLWNEGLARYGRPCMTSMLHSWW